MKNIKNKIKFFFLYFWNLYIKYFIQIDQNKNIKFKKKLSILFIKPCDYLNLYTYQGNNFNKIIFSSLYRMGPVGLFTEFKSEFIKSKIFYKKKNRKKNKIFDQFKSGYNLNIIDFNKYDLVIAFEDIVDVSIINNYTKTLWAIIYEDHSNKMYKKNILMSPKKYDLILNQTLGFTPYSFFRRKHWIDFSYTFGNSNFMKKTNLTHKSFLDIIVDVNQKKYIKEEIKKIFRYKTLILDEKLSFKNYLKTLSKGRFFIAIDCDLPRWGNSLLEAALCQNLVIANKNHFWNSQIVLDELNVKDIKQAIQIIDNINSNKKLYKKLLIKQNKQLNYFNFTRPIYQLRDYVKKANRDLNIYKKL